MREHYSESNIPILQVEKDLAQALNQNQETIRLLREYWLIQSQSSAIKLFQRKSLLKRVAQLQNQGALLVLWSDYPTAEKSKELNLLPDLVFCSEDSRIKMAKPSAVGINLIVNTLKIDVSEIVMIGDRDDRDGVAASRAGIQYFKVGRKANQILDKILREKQKK
jgi:HAD superfamily hydrolase (TIGR01549 family)